MTKKNTPAAPTPSLSKRLPNFFGAFVSHVAPAANNRGESEENRATLQRLTMHGESYAVVSPEAIRNAWREVLAMKYPSNRRRVHDAGQLAVEFKSFPDPDTYIDDWAFGFMVADSKAIKANPGKPYKRDSFVRVNIATGLSPITGDNLLIQSPLHAGQSPWKNSSSSALLHADIAVTAFQFPVCLPFGEISDPSKVDWAIGAMEVLADLNQVAGGHARTYYEMAPASAVIRVTPRLASGFDLYGFKDPHTFAPLSRISASDLPGSEFWIGGEVVRAMAPAERERLTKEGAHLFENVPRLMEALSQHYKDLI